MIQATFFQKHLEPQSAALVMAKLDELGIRHHEEWDMLNEEHAMVVEFPDNTFTDYLPVSGQRNEIGGYHRFIVAGHLFISKAESSSLRYDHYLGKS